MLLADLAEILSGFPIASITDSGILAKQIKL
jgi:hypothetical protein